jgi:hypothetical protein
MARKPKKRYSLVQCRIEACQKINKLVEQKSMSVRAAIRELSSQSGVPFDTLRRWYYKDDESKTPKKSWVKSDPTQTVDNSAKARAKVAKKVVDNIVKSLESDRSESQREHLRKTAVSQADDLGALKLGEELYEMFLTQTAKVDEIVDSNNELETPVDQSKFINELLRMARNAGWEEPEGKGCHQCTCPDRTCENHKEKPKKQVEGKVKAKGEK